VSDQERLNEEIRRQTQEEEQPRERPSVRAVLIDVLVILGVFALAGALVGIVWPHLVAPVRVTRTDFGLLTGETALANRFATDGWFAVLGGVVGLVLGGLLTWWRRSEEVFTVIAVALGAAAASVIAAWVGYQLGPDDPTTVLRHAKVGTTALDVVKVSATAAYFVWPVMALVGALVVLWGRPARSAPATQTHVVQ
jgi:hypothetical protein